MQSTTPHQAHITPLSLQTPGRSAIRWLILGLAVWVYTWLGAQTRMPPALLPIQGAVLASGCGWWIWKVIRRQGLPASPMTAPIIALLGAAAFSAAFSIDRRISFEGLLVSTALVIGFFLICDMLLAGWQPNTFINILLFVTTLILFQALFAVWSSYSFWYSLRVPEYPPFLIPFRILEVAGHPNNLAGLVTMVLPFAIMRLAHARSTFTRLGWGLWLLLADITLFFSRSRGGWIAASVAIALAVSWLVYQQLADSGLHKNKSVLQRVWPIMATAAGYALVFVGLMIITRWSSPSLYATNGSAGGEDRFTFWMIAWRDFLAHPFTGSGLLTFGRVYANSAEAIRTWLPMHAHNLYIDTLAQQGLLGILALGWVLVAGARTLLRAAPFRSPLLVCVCAALAGVLIHSVFDVVTALPTNALLVVLLVALGLHGAGALHAGRAGLSRWAFAALVAPLVLVAVLLRQNAGYTAQIDAILSAQDRDWATASQKMDQAVNLDPHVDFYAGQRGYAYGVLANPDSGNIDPPALEAALTSYTSALRVEPAYVPNLLNAATLLRQAGADQEADDALRAALPRGKDWALPALLLANRASSTGRTTDANALYADAFQREPQARDMAACRQNAACRTAAQQIPPLQDDLRSILAEARALLTAGQPQSALDSLRQIPITNADPRPWISRADAYTALGQFPQARYALQVAEALGAASPATVASAASAYARFYVAQDQPASAISILEFAATTQRGGEAYSFFVFRRPGLPGLLIPALDRLRRTTDDLAVYRQLADLYAAAGRTDDATWTKTQGDVLAQLLDAK